MVSAHQGVSAPGHAVTASGGARDLRRLLVAGSCHWLFYLALVTVTVGVAVSGSETIAVAVALSLAVGGWYGYWNLHAYDRLSLSRGARVAYVAGAALGWLALLAVDSGYGVAGVVMFGQLFGYLRRWLAWLVVLTVVGLTLTFSAFSGVDEALGVGLRWHGLDASAAVNTVVILLLVALCVYLDRAVATTRSELADAQRRSGALRERARLAGDLHDTLTQNLSSMVMQLEAARDAYRADDPGVADNLDRALATARSGLAEVRGLVWDLRPESLAGDTLDRALGRLTDRLAAEEGIEARLVVTGERTRLPTRTEVTVLRVVQEALANVRKHAQATTLTVTLSYIGDGAGGSVVAVDVCDDGAGFDPATPRVPRHDGGLGLVSMRERVATEGGQLAVESAPGEGTSVAVQLPVERVP